LIRFVLLGSHELEEYAILAVRIALGVFFAISGANKLFVAQRTHAMYETLVAANVPFPRLMTYFVSSVEFVGGCLLVAGLLSSVACFVLLFDMLTATAYGETLRSGRYRRSWLYQYLRQGAK
jgi:putative oxidoreductase